MEIKFKAGDLARIRDTGEIVTINAPSQGINQLFYIVFQNGKKNRYKESDLIPYVDREEEMFIKMNEMQYANADAFQKYAYYRLFSESQEGNLFSYQGNKIIFNPFQYKPLMKFLSIDSDERLLIADEVGVGKTIESGIIIDELIARAELHSDDAILIVCPSILCNKWRAELRSKFLLDDFHIHDGSSLSYMLKDIRDIGKNQYPHSIVSEQLFRGERYQKLLKECMEEIGEPFFKLLIVDECHHYRNPGTNTYKFGSILSLCSERVIMLSATPFNLKSDDLYNQLHILNPSLFSEKELFQQLLNQIRCVNQTIALVKKNNAETNDELLRCVEELKGIADSNQYISDDYKMFYDKIVAGVEMDVKDKVEFEKIVSMLNPIASSFTRTLKKDAIEHRVSRETMTVEVHFTDQEADVYKSFLETNLLRYRMFGVSEKAFGLILNGLERIAASSIIALEKNIKGFIRMSDEEFRNMFSEDGELGIESVKSMKELLLGSYKELLEKIKRVGDHDSKYLTFIKLIENIQAVSDVNKRVIVFSYYTETLKYLRRKLVADGYRVALMYGDTPFETSLQKKDEDGFVLYGRNDIMRDFENGKYDILLLSEVGGEGLDFQFCASLINYDLPYNPMRIEQRIGRIDRMGQKADKIFIGNLCIDNTIDIVINRVLLSRIASAADLVGELEPIIAKELVEINKQIITREFSEEELKKREWELAQRIEKAKQTREEFEEARYDLVNDKGFRKEFEESIKQSRISPHESLLYVYSFLKKENGCWCKILSHSAASIHLSKNLCERLNVYYRKKKMGKNGEDIKKLLDNGGDLEIDFDGDSAYDNTDRVFFKPAGTFVRFITDYIRSMDSENAENVFYLCLKQEQIQEMNKGRYWLLVYDMEFEGFFNTKTYEYFLSDENGLFVRVLDDEMKKELLQIVKNEKIPTDVSYAAFDEMRMNIEEVVEKRKEEISAMAVGKNIVKIESRIQALKNLSDIRIQKMEDELLVATGKDEERIRRAINREKEKLTAKISILEEKTKFVGTYALDAVCLLDIV